MILSPTSSMMFFLLKSDFVLLCPWEKNSENFYLSIKPYTMIMKVRYCAKKTKYCYPFPIFKNHFPDVNFVN